MKSPISLSINLDSLNEAYGFPKKFDDPTFHEIFNRLEKIADRYNFPLSIFIVGKDLENIKNQYRVKEWHDKGYEIGNHSYNHLFNFGSLNKLNLRQEIFKTHEKIYKIIGSEPKGFIAPVWGYSKKLINILIELDYEYDTSSFPSIFLYPMITKICFNHLTNIKKLIKILNRSDWFDPFLKSTEPILLNKNLEINNLKDSQNILEMPLPTLSRTSPCIWHTMLFVLNKNYIINQITQLLNTHQSFYYVMHPADFLDDGDLDKKFSLNLERINIGLKFKLDLIDEIFQLFALSGRRMVTMGELALYNKNQIINENNKLKNK